MRAVTVQVAAAAAAAAAMLMVTGTVRPDSLGQGTARREESMA